MIANNDKIRKIWFWFWVKSPSDGTCLGEPLGGFCDAGCHFIFDLVLNFISRLLYRVTGTPPWVLRPVKASTSSELYPDYFSSTASATVLSGYFLPTGIFYLTLLPNIFATTCFYQGLPGCWQFFHEVWRASYWSSKPRPSPSVCLIHSNRQSFIHLKFVFIHVNIAKGFTCGENFDKKYYFFDSVLDRIRVSSRSATTLISQQPWKHKSAATLICNHKLQNNCYLKKYISEYECKNYVNLWIIND